MLFANRAANKLVSSVTCAATGSARSQYGFGCALCPLPMSRRIAASIDVCLQCDDHTQVDSFGACMSCPPGLQRTPGAAQCVPCTVGTAQSQGKATGCLQCDVGSYSAINGSVMCFPCSLGTHSPSRGAEECTPCSAGSFSSSPGASVCEECAVGGYCPDAGAASALVYKQCPAGTYNPDRGSSSAAACKACAAGKASPIPGSSDPDACKECLPGSVAPSDGTGVCTLCEAGKFQGEKGKTACETCTLGCEQAAWRSNPDAFKAATDSLTRLALTKTSHACLPWLLHRLLR